MVDREEIVGKELVNEGLTRTCIRETTVKR